MREDLGSRRVVVKGREVFIGVDVHKVSWHVTARTGGEEIFNSGIPGHYQALRGLLDQFKDGRMKVAYEAGPCGFWLHDKLKKDGIEVIVVPPSLIPIESGNRVKTDKRDSRKLARLLESQMLKRVYVLTEEDRADRELLRTRRQVLEHRSDVGQTDQEQTLISWDCLSLFNQNVDSGLSSMAKGTDL